VIFNHSTLFFVYSLIFTTNLMSIFEKLFDGKIRSWNRSQAVLQHILSLFTPVNKIYKINKITKRCFTYFFNFKHNLNPRKDDIYEIQNTVSDELGQKIKDKLLKYYHENDFLDLSLTFIDGHVIAYFGKKAFQILKHSTRNDYLKALEIFNFSDKKGRIFYFRADHGAKGMAYNIEQLLIEVERIIGLKNVKLLAFDRGGRSYQLYKDLTLKFKLNFITLVIKTDPITKQINEIISKNNFKTIAHKSKDEYLSTRLVLDGKSYRALLVRDKVKKKIHPFITNMNFEELSDDELLKNYSMHWRQEQEHNAFGKLGGNMHAKVLQEQDFIDTNKIKKKQDYMSILGTTRGKIRDIERRIEQIKMFKSNIQSKIIPKSKQTDNKTKRKNISFYKKELKNLLKEKNDFELKTISLSKKISNIPDEPTLKRFKSGPVDYSISIINLVNNLNSRLVEIGTKGKRKFQLSTLVGTFYSIQAYVSENSETIFVEYFNIKQNEQISMVQNLCSYFNKKNVKLRGKTIKFSIKPLEK